MEGTAAEAARGSGSLSQVAPSPLQCKGSKDTEVVDHRFICMDKWIENSFVMPCLHCFCYGFILQWLEKDPQCPLCKGEITSILHSVRADDDFQEHVIIPPMTAPPVLPARGAHREPDTPNLHCPAAHQQRVTEGRVPDFVGGFELPNWMSSFSDGLAILQTLHSWFCQSLEMLFETAPFRAQHTRIPEQQRCRVDCHLPRQWDTRGATGQEDSSSSPSPGPARSSEDEMPCTSSSVIGWGPSIHPSASTTIHMNQEPQKESERLCPSPPNCVRGSDPSRKRPQRPQKRRASNPKGPPPCKRPRH